MKSGEIYKSEDGGLFLKLLEHGTDMKWKCELMLRETPQDERPTIHGSTVYLHKDYIEMLYPTLVKS